MPFVVVIDDRPAKRRQLLELAASIEADVNIEGFANPQAAIEASSDIPPDLVIMGRPPSEMSLDIDVFMENPLVVVTWPDHPLAGKKSDRWSEP